MNGKVNSEPEFKGILEKILNEDYNLDIENPILIKSLKKGV